MIWWGGIGEEDDNEKKREVLRNILLAACHNGICSSQVVRGTHVECYCLWLHIAGVSHDPATHNLSVWCC